MAPPPRQSKIDRFWQRVTEGMALSELWMQFRRDATSSYRLYSKDVNAARGEDPSQRRGWSLVLRQYFWAIVEKLTPARRVLLLAALVLIFLPGGEWSHETPHGEVKVFALDLHFYGGLLMFALLVLEVGDRVVMKRDLQIAKEIQEWLLPAQPPAVPGAEIAFLTRPANTVAGDYYDVFARLRPSEAERSAGETYLLAVADVAGKSVPAAMLMATFQASLKTLSATHGPLTMLVERMNRYACSNSQNGRRFTTAFIAEYDPATRRLTYVNAGHNNPILRRASGQIERLDVGGMPLGIMDGVPYASGEVLLASGDLLAIFTDGLTEAEDLRQQEYGEMRLQVMLHSGARLPARTLLETIMVDVDRFVGGAPQHDDVTCLLMKVL
ncbi:PP2C family protein-serine/threonine phosphatase [Silvibacterium sp.]|uniref:PP2C family protein-serine/threonine phosphatase n=1 Tax=Silvibacterium sp. TaxID=1964179 RepID=UPI0039E50005